MRSVSLLGATGSIGSSTLDVIRRHKDEFKLHAIAACKSVDKTVGIIKEFKPQRVALFDEESAVKLKEILKEQNLYTEVLAGAEGVEEIAGDGASDIVVDAIVGAAGLKPVLAAVKTGCVIALANKEALVMSGKIFFEQVKKYDAKVLPVDSEHSAIFQSLNGEPANRIKNILLTASGGPFRGWTKEQMANVQVEDALKHPNWNMGRKITIDSATMVNKGLEVMEAGWLFSVSPDQIKVVVQPQSIIHSMVEYVDGAVIAQLGVPDMKLPIQYALFYPDRRPMYDNEVDFFQLAQITFAEPDMEVFTGLKLAFDAFRMGGSVPTVFNAANEKAVSLFLNRKIGFLDIPALIGLSMEQHKKVENPTVEQILETEASTYEFIESRCK